MMGKTEKEKFKEIIGKICDEELSDNELWHTLFELKHTIENQNGFLGELYPQPVLDGLLRISDKIIIKHKKISRENISRRFDDWDDLIRYVRYKLD